MTGGFFAAFDAALAEQKRQGDQFNGAFKANLAAERRRKSEKGEGLAAGVTRLAGAEPGAISKGIDYGVAVAQRGVGAALDLGGKVAGGVVKGATLGAVDVNPSFGGLLDMAWKWGGGQGTWTEKQKAALRAVEGDKGALKFTRTLGEEVISFTAPFGLMGKGTSALGKGAAAAIELPGTIVRGIGSRVANRMSPLWNVTAESLGKGATPIISKMASRVGMSTAEIKSAFERGSLLRDVISRSSLPMKVARWAWGNAPAIAGAAAGFGAMELAATKGDVGHSLVSMGMSVPLVGLGQLANRLESALSRGPGHWEVASRSTDGAEAVMRYLESGKGWNPAAARFVAGAVEGVGLAGVMGALNPKELVDTWRAIGEGDEEALFGFTTKVLGSVLGLAAMRGMSHDRIPEWRAKHPDDGVASFDWTIRPPGGPPGPSTTVAELQRMGWQAKRGESGGAELTVPGFDGTVKVRDVGGDTELEVIWGTTIRNPRVNSLLEWATDAEVPKGNEPLRLTGNDADRMLDALVSETAVDNMAMRTNGAARGMMETAPGSWRRKGFEVVRRFGENKARKLDDPWFSVPRLEADVPARAGGTAEDIAERFTNWVEVHGGQMPPHLGQALSRVAAHAERQTTDSGLMAMLGQVVSDPALRLRMEQQPETAARLIVRAAAGTIEPSAALAKLSGADEVAPLAEAQVEEGAGEAAPSSPWDKLEAKLEVERSKDPPEDPAADPLDAWRGSIKALMEGKAETPASSSEAASEAKGAASTEPGAVGETGQPVIAEQALASPRMGPESGAIYIPTMADLRALVTGSSLGRYFDRPVAKEARGILERNWGLREATFIKVYADAYEMMAEFERATGTNPLTGNRATTSLGRRVARAFNRDAMLDAMTDLRFLIARTGNPGHDVAGRPDTIADVAARLAAMGPNIMPLANRMQTLFQSLHARAASTPLMRTPAYRANFVPVVWKSGPGGKPIDDINKLLFGPGTGLEHPAFVTTGPTDIAAGIRAGWTPRTLNPFEAILAHAKLVTDVEVSVKALEQLAAMKLGQFVHAGTGKLIDQFAIMPKAIAPPSYMPYPSPLLQGMSVHPELLGGTSRGWVDQSKWDRRLQKLGGFDILDRLLGAADFNYGAHPLLNAWKHAAQTLKGVAVSTGLFHPWVIGVENTIVYAAPTVGELLRLDPQAIKKLAGKPSAIAAAITGDMKTTLDLLRSQATEYWAEHGMQMSGMPSDLNPKAFDWITDSIRKFGEKFMPDAVSGRTTEPIASVLESLQGFTNRYLWDVLLPASKVVTAEIWRAREEQRLGRALSEDEARTIAKHINGVQGNTDWNTVWWIPKRVSDLMAGTMFFAWDWTMGNMLTGAGRTVQGGFQSFMGQGTQNLRYGAHSLAIGFAKAVLTTQIIQALLWGLFAEDGDRDKMEKAGRGRQGDWVWNNEGQSWDDNLFSVRTPWRDETGAQIILRPWKQVKESFDWLFKPFSTGWNKMSRPLQYALRTITGANSPGHLAVRRDLEILNEDPALWKFTKDMLTFFQPFAFGNVATPAGWWGLASPFPISKGTTNYKVREHLTLVLTNYAREGDPQALDDIQWITQGATLNSLDANQLFTQANTAARALCYRQYWQGLNENDMEKAGLAFLGSARLGAEDDNVERSLRQRFKHIAGKPPLTGDEAEFARRAGRAQKSILENVEDARKPMVRIKRRVLEDWKAEPSVVRPPEAEPALPAGR